MQKTVVVNLRFEPYDVYIGRAGKGQDGYFGNPFPLKKGEDRGSSISKFESYFYDRINKDPEFLKRVKELKGKKLGCFCKDKNGNGPCHGDVYVKFIDGIN